LVEVENIMIYIVTGNGTLIFGESARSTYSNAVKRQIRFEIRYFVMTLNVCFFVVVIFYLICIHYFQSLFVPIYSD
jgi:hypothetical protein